MNRNVLTLGLLALVAITGGIIVNQLSILRSSNLTSISPASQQAAVSDFNSSLVAHYTFDEGNGTTAGDSSGKGNTGTLTNGPTWTSGKVGSGALSFDGVDDIGSAGAIPAPPVPAFSLSPWVQRGNTPSH